MRRIAGIGLLLCGAVLANSALSGVWVTTATAQRPHWTGARERVIVIENNLPAEWLAPLRAAAADWSRSPYVKFVLGPAGTCWDLATRVEFCWSSYTPTPSWIGLASTWRDDAGHLSYVTLEANALKSWGPGKRRFVACHELGHALGVSHRPEVAGQSCMMPKFSDVTIFPAKPDPVDMGALVTAYAHRDVAPSPSPTSSPTATESPTPTPSPSPAESPTATDPPTVTDTSTATGSPTSSGSPTASPSSSAPPTPTASPTSSAPPTPTASPTWVDPEPSPPGPTDPP